MQKQEPCNSNDRLEPIVMKWAAVGVQKLELIRFRVLRLATIKDIPAEDFNQLVERLLRQGWCKTSEYDGFDAWIDYGRISLKTYRYT